MRQLFFIAMGGAVGSMLRYLVSIGMYAWLGREFPYGTLTVNVLGSLLMGFLTIFLIERLDSLSDVLRALLLVGFLGGFTTFSSFSMETLSQLESGDMKQALANIVLNLGLCLLAVYLGALVARKL